jgi:hypothetical protein
MKTKTPKLTTIEQRAYDYCQRILEWGQADIAVEWKKSSMYGYNPVISSHYGKCTNISGCGYDKLSACLASFLCYMFTGDAQRSVAVTQGCGVSSVQDALLKLGWKLDRTANGNTFDGFHLSRIETPATA